MMLYMRRLVKLTSRFIIITWIVDTFLTMSLYTMWMIMIMFKNGVPSCWKVFWYVYHTQDIKSIKTNGHMVAQDGFWLDYCMDEFTLHLYCIIFEYKYVHIIQVCHLNCNDWKCYKLVSECIYININHKLLWSVVLRL